MKDPGPLAELSIRVGERLAVSSEMPSQLFLEERDLSF